MVSHEDKDERHATVRAAQWRAGNGGLGVLRRAVLLGKTTMIAAINYYWCRCCIIFLHHDNNSCGRRHAARRCSRARLPSGLAGMH